MDQLLRKKEKNKGRNKKTLIRVEKSVEVRSDESSEVKNVEVRILRVVKTKRVWGLKMMRVVR